MGSDYFSVPIFFVLFRESLEAAIVCSVLLGLIEQIVKGSDYGTPTSTASPTLDDRNIKRSSSATSVNEGAMTILTSNSQRSTKQILRKLRIQVFAGALAGLILALAIGAAFIAVYYTQVKDLWSSSEEIWEGVFSLIACIMIFIMALAMLKMDRAKAKWAWKLRTAFEKKAAKQAKGDRPALAEKYLLFFLPFVTVLREGLEGVVFVGGLSFGESAKAIPIPAIVGLICGLGVGVAIYFSSKRVNISYFLVVSTSILLLIGAGLASKTVGYFQTYKFNKGVGGDVSETGDGPGSFDVDGNVWHLPYGNPERPGNGGWSIFNAILGWNNTATYGSILAYIFYWLFVIGALVYMKWREGRIIIFGKESQAGRFRRARRAAASEQQEHEQARVGLPSPSSSQQDKGTF